MGYKIEYDSGTATRVAVRDSRKKKKWLAWSLAVAVIVGVLAFPQGREALRGIFLPGDEAVTAQALQDLVTDLRAGEGVSEAMTAFCQQVIRESGA